KNEERKLEEQKEGNWTILSEPPRLGVQSSNLEKLIQHQRLGVPSPPQGQVIHA
ncbi:hypothetical protein PIB30_097972, partial [Stylosanthes scabra]|nr:hypothetical protein [Stylosanthes scabra]